MASPFPCSSSGQISLARLPSTVEAPSARHGSPCVPCARCSPSICFPPAHPNFLQLVGRARLLPAQPLLRSSPCTRARLPLTGSPRPELAPMALGQALILPVHARCSYPSSSAVILFPPVLCAACSFLCLPRAQFPSVSPLPVCPSVAPFPRSSTLNAVSLWCSALVADRSFARVELPRCPAPVFTDPAVELTAQIPARGVFFPRQDRPCALPSPSSRPALAPAMTLVLGTLVVGATRDIRDLLLFLCVWYPQNASMDLSAVGMSGRPPPRAIGVLPRSNCSASSSAHPSSTTHSIVLKQ
jgi:hypothetical protein